MSGTHLLLLAIILFLLFGANRLPEITKSMGKAIRGFKEGLNEIDVEAKDVPSQHQQNQQVSHQNQDQQTASEKEKSGSKHSS